MPLFEDVKFFFPPSLSPERQAQFTVFLTANGASPVPLDEATHVITNSHEFEGKEDLKPGVAVVTDDWVERSLLLGKLQSALHYSPDPSMLFSGIVACATDLSTSDTEVLSAGITALGGQWRPGLTREVTHLFAVATGSDKYNTAMHFQKDTRMKVLVPHWFDDSVRLGIRGLPTATYEWPDPAVLKSGKGVDALAESAGTDSRAQSRLSGEKKTLYKTALMASGQEGQVARTERDIWRGRRILLSSDLELSDGRKDVVEAGIIRTGGIMLHTDPENEESQMDEADALISRYRWGPLYIKAVKGHKLVGTLTWLFHVETIGTVSAPTAQLLHYPIPKKPIDGFSSHEITVTNYTGESREYLKKLITLMGATFTPSMSGRNTVLIAAYLSGVKTAKARNWSIPVVNHTWLEDCFVQWKNLTVGQEKYVSFPPGVDFAEVLGERGVGRAAVQDTLWELETESESAKKVRPQPSPTKDQQTTVAPKSAATEASAKDAREVEDEVAIMDDVAPMDVDEDAGPGGDEMPTDAQPQVPKPTAASDADDEDDEPLDADEVLNAKARQRVDRKGKGKALPIQYRSKRSARIKSPERSSVEEARHALEVMDVDESEAGPSKRHARSKAPISAGKSRRIVTPEVDEDEDDDDEPPAHATTHKRSANHRISPSVVGTAAKSPTKSPIKPPAKGAALTPRRTVSVLMPPVGTGRAIITTPRSAKAGHLGKKAAGSSLPDMSTNEEEPNTTRRRPPKAHAPDTSMDRAAETPSTTGRLQRSAATRATQRLRDEIMPDVVNFQKEMRRGSVKIAGETDVRSAKGKKESRAATAKSSSKKRISPETDVEEEESSLDERSRKKQKTGNSKGKAVAVDSADDSEDERVVMVVKKKPSHATQVGHKRRDSATGDHRSKKAQEEVESGGASASASATHPIRILTTGVKLSDDVGLTKLGAKMISKPSECTHLVLKSLGRTEKLLCAMAVAPCIVTEKWATASVAAKQFLPVDRYQPADIESEKRYRFKLKEALERAKENGGQLYSDMVFYVTPKVPVDKKLLKSVVMAHGGQFRTQTPTARGLGGKDNHYVISCQEDASIWRPIAQAGHTIFNHELLLTGALTQQIDWENPLHRLSG
ncbi:hypothetical protein EVG20_g6835 [Dentipellis fragilis]|uniref:BRCT domain-containing protein n=1 Tax=Dentipellis fragilis TaxID=205917 RepID=A0A4Y9YJA2_9AGAM|nr:hypothetical protein EVG20_g6835 [Dentipellis fragilis]